jgi:hypothetical protein
MIWAAQLLGITNYTVVWVIVMTTLIAWAAQYALERPLWARYRPVWERKVSSASDIKSA